MSHAPFQWVTLSFERTAPTLPPRVPERCDEPRRMVHGSGWEGPPLQSSDPPVPGIFSFFM